MVAAHAAQQTNLEPPGRYSQGAVGANAAAIQFQLWGKTFASGNRPGVHVANHIYIEIAKYEKACSGIFFAAHGERHLIIPYCGTSNAA